MPQLHESLHLTMSEAFSFSYSNPVQLTLITQITTRKSYSIIPFLHEITDQSLSSLFDCGYPGHYERFPFKPFHSWEWSTSKFPCSLTRNMTSHIMENLTFHSLFRSKIIILQILATSLIQLLLKGWENTLFELRSERVKSFLTGADFVLLVTLSQLQDVYRHNHIFDNLPHLQHPPEQQAVSKLHCWSCWP